MWQVAGRAQDTEMLRPGTIFIGPPSWSIQSTACSTTVAGDACARQASQECRAAAGSKAWQSTHSLASEYTPSTAPTAGARARALRRC